MSAFRRNRNNIFLLHFLYDINKDQEGEQPGEHDKLGDAVAQDNLRRVTTLLVYHSNLDVSQQTYQHKDTRKIEILGMEILDDLRTHRIHDVTYQGYGSRNRDSLVDESEVVADGILAGSLARLLHAQHIIAALGKLMKRVMRKVISTIHLLSTMPVATPPASRRSTKPKATIHTSMMAYCLNLAQ